MVLPAERWGVLFIFAFIDILMVSEVRFYVASLFLFTNRKLCSKMELTTIMCHKRHNLTYIGH